MMMTSLYERVGGEPFFSTLVSGFYRRVAADPVLRPMYPEDLEPAERRLRLFLIQYFGGPQTYDQERGHPRLRMRHMPFFIDQRARDIWLEHMNASLDDVLNANVDRITASDSVIVRDYLRDTSQFLVNRGGFSMRG